MKNSLRTIALLTCTLLSGTAFGQLSISKEVTLEDNQQGQLKMSISGTWEDGMMSYTSENYIANFVITAQPRVMSYGFYDVEVEGSGDNWTFTFNGEPDVYIGSADHYVQFVDLVVTKTGESYDLEGELWVNGQLYDYHGVEAVENVIITLAELQLL